MYCGPSSFDSIKWTDTKVYSLEQLVRIHNDYSTIHETLHSTSLSTGGDAVFRLAAEIHRRQHNLLIAHIAHRRRTHMVSKQHAEEKLSAFASSSSSSSNKDQEKQGTVKRENDAIPSRSVQYKYTPPADDPPNCMMVSETTNNVEDVVRKRKNDDDGNPRPEKKTKKRKRWTGSVVSLEYTLVNASQIPVIRSHMSLLGPQNVKGAELALQYHDKTNTIHVVWKWAKGIDLSPTAFQIFNIAHPSVRQPLKGRGGPRWIRMAIGRIHALAMTNMTPSPPAVAIA